MNKEQMKRIIKEWILRMDIAEKIPANIVALNFGLYEPYGVELIGSANYDADNDDWACYEDFIPLERDCPALNIDETLNEWEAVLDAISEILKELVQELSGVRLLSVLHITTGFCDGDLVVIK